MNFFNICLLPQCLPSRKVSTQHTNPTPEQDSMPQQTVCKLKLIDNHCVEVTLDNMIIQDKDLLYIYNSEDQDGGQFMAVQINELVSGNVIPLKIDTEKLNLGVGYLPKGLSSKVNCVKIFYLQNIEGENYRSIDEGQILQFTGNVAQKQLKTRNDKIMFNQPWSPSSASAQQNFGVGDSLMYKSTTKHSFKQQSCDQVHLEILLDGSVPSARGRRDSEQQLINEDERSFSQLQSAQKAVQRSSQINLHTLSQSKSSFKPFKMTDSLKQKSQQQEPAVIEVKQHPNKCHTQRFQSQLQRIIHQSTLLKNRKSSQSSEILLFKCQSIFTESQITDQFKSSNKNNLNDFVDIQIQDQMFRDNPVQKIQKKSFKKQSFASGGVSCKKNNQKKERGNRKIKRFLPVQLQ